MVHGIQLPHSVDRATASKQAEKDAHKLGASSAFWLSRTLTVDGVWRTVTERVCVGVRDVQR